MKNGNGVVHLQTALRGIFIHEHKTIDNFCHPFCVFQLNDLTA